MTGIVILVVVLLAATAFGLWRRRADGRMRDRTTGRPIPVADDDGEVGMDEADGETLDQRALGVPLGAEATLVQFSTAFCQPCRATRRILDEVAAMVEGVVHVEIDAEAHLDLVRHLDIRRTPTVLILDSDGVIRKRASGLPRKVDVIAAVGAVTGPASPSQ